MKNVFLISDTHFGHANMYTFLREDGTRVRQEFQNVQEADEAMVDRWNAVVNPKDKVYHLGDVVINRKFMHTLSRLNGDKVLIKGNHDIFRLEDYTPHFRDIRAYHVLDRAILSHVPIHPSQLGRFKGNIHGHLHEKLVMGVDFVPDAHYISVCVEHTQYAPMELSVVMKRLNT